MEIKFDRPIIFFSICLPKSIKSEKKQIMEVISLAKLVSVTMFIKLIVFLQTTGIVHVRVSDNFLRPQSESIFYGRTNAFFLHIY